MRRCFVLRPFEIDLSELRAGDYFLLQGDENCPKEVCRAVEDAEVDGDNAFVNAIELGKRVFSPTLNKLPPIIKIPPIIVII